MGVDNTDIQENVLLGMAQGAAYAVDIFTQRMDELNARRHEHSQSEFFRNLALEHSKQSRTLFEICQRLEKKIDLYKKDNDALRSNESVLSDQINKLNITVAEKMKYARELLSRLEKIEDLSSRQSANLYALGKYRDLVLQEFSNLQEANNFTSTDAQKSSEFIESQVKDFMRLTAPKKSTPM